MNDGGGPSKSITAPMCMWAFGPSWARKDASTAVSRSPCACAMVPPFGRGEGTASEHGGCQPDDERHEQQHRDHPLVLSGALERVEQWAPGDVADADDGD